jgi:hypothetical protein
MTFDRRHPRTVRKIRLDLERLGERIAPSVYHAAILGNVTTPIGTLHKPIVAGGPVQFFAINVGTGNGGTTGKMPVLHNPIVPNPPISF